MSNDYDDDGSGRYEQIVRKRIERMENVLDEIERHGTYVNVSPALQRELVSAIISCHRVLSVLEDSTVLDDEDMPDISPIRSRINRTTRVRTASRERGKSVAFEERPAVDELPLEYLERVAARLERTAAKLNFWAPAPDKTEHNEFDHGDLAHLLDQRGQDEALEKVPGGDT